MIYEIFTFAQQRWEYEFTKLSYYKSRSLIWRSYNIFLFVCKKTQIWVLYEKMDDWELFNKQRVVLRGNNVEIDKIYSHRKRDVPSDHLS